MAPMYQTAVNPQLETRVNIDQFHVRGREALLTAAEWGNRTKGFPVVMAPSGMCFLAVSEDDNAPVTDALGLEYPFPTIGARSRMESLMTIDPLKYTPFLKFACRNFLWRILPLYRKLHEEGDYGFPLDTESVRYLTTVSTQQGLEKPPEVVEVVEMGSDVCIKSSIRGVPKTGGERSKSGRSIELVVAVGWSLVTNRGCVDDNCVEPTAGTDYINLARVVREIFGKSVGEREEEFLQVAENSFALDVAAAADAYLEDLKFAVPAADIRVSEDFAAWKTKWTEKFTNLAEPMVVGRCEMKRMLSLARLCMYFPADKDPSEKMNELYAHRRKHFRREHIPA